MEYARQRGRRRQRLSLVEKEWRPMNDSEFDQAARKLHLAQTRRGMMRALAGLAVGGMAVASTTTFTRAKEQDLPLPSRYGNEVTNEGKSKSKKKKLKRCKKVGQQCSRWVAGWCGYYWLDYGSCVASLGSCCSFERKCKPGKANSCIANNPYYFLV